MNCKIFSNLTFNYDSHSIGLIDIKMGSGVSL